MQFEPEQLYHLYNRGNNRQKIFFNRENYLFFLKKIRKHLMPYCDVLCYCLMPNHFHLMVYVDAELTHPMNASNQMGADAAAASDQMTVSHPITAGQPQHPISKSIAVILRSYTRAIQKQQNITGSLFQQKTKAKLLDSSDDLKVIR